MADIFVAFESLKKSTPFILPIHSNRWGMGVKLVIVSRIALSEIPNVCAMVEAAKIFWILWWPFSFVSSNLNSISGLSGDPEYIYKFQQTFQ